MEKGDSRSEGSVDLKQGLEFSGPESVSGRVLEVVGELPSEKPSSAQPSSSQKSVTLSLEERKVKLLSTLPSDEKAAEMKMRGEIFTVLNRKISKLQQEVSRTSSPYHLSRIVQEIRYLNKILLDLAGAIFEYLKTLWLRLVHGLSI